MAPPRFPRDSPFLGHRKDLVREYVAETRHQLNRKLSVAIGQAVTEAVTQAYSQIFHETGGALPGYLRNILPTEGERLAIHQQVAEKAHRSMMGSFAQRVTARQSAMSRTSYRSGPGGGRLGGTIRGALKNKEKMLEVTENRISFVNYDWLDKQAAHWYRLNFGAGQRGMASRQGSFTMIFGGQTIGTIGFNTGPSVNDVVMPPGYFMDEMGGRHGANPARRSQDAFYLRNRSAKKTATGDFTKAGVGPGVYGRPLQRRVTAGIEARNFLDAGVYRIAKDLPRAYDNFFRDKAAATGRFGTRIEIDASLARPRGMTRRPTKTSTFPQLFRRGLPTGY